MKPKLLCITAMLLWSSTTFAQKSDEKVLLDLSKKIFDLEVSNNIGQLADIFDSKFVVVGSSGDIQTKQEYIKRLQSGNFKHNSIEVEQSIPTVQNNTGTIIGKGKFKVTVSGKEISLHLAYLEVFTKSKTGWKLLAMHAAALQN